MGGGSGQAGLESSINTQNNVSFAIGSSGGLDSGFTPYTSQTQTQKASTDAGWGVSSAVGMGGDAGSGGVGVGTSSVPANTTANNGVMQLITPTNLAIGACIFLLAKKL